MNYYWQWFLVPVYPPKQTSEQVSESLHAGSQDMTQRSHCSSQPYWIPPSRGLAGEATFAALTEFSMHLKQACIAVLSCPLPCPALPCPVLRCAALRCTLSAIPKILLQWAGASPHQLQSTVDFQSTPQHWLAKPSTSLREYAPGVWTVAVHLVTESSQLTSSYFMDVLINAPYGCL